MEIFLAAEELNKEPKTIAVDKILEIMENNVSYVFYFDRKNSHKDILELNDLLEEKGFNIYLREIKFGLADNEYIYEMNLIK